MSQAKRKSITQIADGELADAAGVERFALAMTKRLAEKRDEGRGGWNKPEECTEQHLRDLMAVQVLAGDMVDVANYAMMIWNRRHPRG